jgi:acyl-CoA thioesterase-1
MRTIPLLLLLTFLAFATGCKERVPGGRVVFLGDSLTAGYGLEPSEAYPALIHVPGMESVNLGVSGDEVSQGLTRLRQYFADGNDAALVVVALGANDILRGNSHQTIEDGLVETIRECKSRNIPVLLCGVDIPLTRGSAQVFREVAKAEDVPLLPDLLKGVLGKSNLMQADDAHPNAAGQQVLARNVEGALRKHFDFP